VWERERARVLAVFGFAKASQGPSLAPPTW
jgi:hypothetical protein